MIVLKVGLFLLSVVFALIFAYYNLQPAKLSLFSYSVELPLFLIVLISFVVGFLISYVVAEVRSVGWRRYGERLKKGLVKLWTGYPSSAEKEFSKLSDREEVVPLYVGSLKDQSKTPSLYLQKYDMGIVETVLAENVFREDRDRAVDLLEKAAGKNPKNLRAKRMLRSLYYIEGEKQKAVDLQKDIIKDCEKSVREDEKRILGSMLADSEEVEEIEDLPPSLASLFLISSGEDKKKRKKAIRKAFEEGLQNELVLLMVEKNAVNPELMEVIEGNKGDLSPTVLALLYTNLGMLEKLEELKEKLPAPIRTFVGRDEFKGCYDELLKVLKLWECIVCGKEYGSYSPVCSNCLNWNRIRVKRRE